MVDAWPASLPQCFNVPYSEGMGDSLVEYSVDQGPAISRPRTSAASYPITGQMKLTRDQVAILKAFIKATLISGSLPFSFRDPTVIGQTLLVKFTKGNFPTFQQIGSGKYRVSLQFMVLP